MKNILSLLLLLTTITYGQRNIRFSPTQTKSDSIAVFNENGELGFALKDSFLPQQTPVTDSLHLKHSGNTLNNLALTVKNSDSIQSLTVYGSGDVTNLSKGSTNTPYGIGALQNITNPDYNIALGLNAMKGLNETQTLVSRNIGIGVESLMSVNNAIRNVSIGDGAAKSLSIGNYNITLGDDTFSNLLVGNNNIGIGASAGAGVMQGDNNVFIGGYQSSDMIIENNVVLADGAGNVVFSANGLGGQVQLPSMSVTDVINGTPSTPITKGYFDTVVDTDDTGWNDIGTYNANVDVGNVEVRKKGGRVFIVGRVDIVQSPSGTVMFNLPSIYRPNMNVRTWMYKSIDGANDELQAVYVLASGNISAGNSNDFLLGDGRYDFYIEYTIID